jgi:hypothetical protein
MIRTVLTLLFVIVGALAVSSAHAAPGVSLSSAQNLGQVQLGDFITVAVQLTGLEAGQSLEALAATIEYDHTLFGFPSMAQGPIVPSPLNDPTDMLLAGMAGMADGSFMTDGGEAFRIADNGVFFSFTVQALKQGGGQFSTTYASADEFNPVNPAAPIYHALDPSPLNFTIVPEPSAAWLIASLIVGVCVLRRFGR